MSDPAISLRPVDKSNWVACAKLTLAAEQAGYVAPNVSTIAESKFEPHFHLRAVYAGETLAGMLAFCHEDDPVDLELFWLFRLMIDRRFQRRGYGRKAVRLAIDEMARLGAKRVCTMHKPSNTVAAELYPKLGFTPTGETLDDGDVVLELKPGRSERRRSLDAPTNRPAQSAQP